MSHPDRADDSNAASDPSPQREQDRIARIRSGDSEAFREVYLEYYPPLVLFVTSLVHARGTAEDVVQEVFWELWEHRAAWHPTRIAPYLFRAARHRAIDELRRVRRTEGQSLSVAETIDGWRGVAPERPDSTVETQDAERLLMQAIAALPKRRRTALLLRVVQGMSYAEIGDAMSISEKAAFILVARAKESLQPIRDRFLQSF